MPMTSEPTADRNWPNLMRWLLGLIFLILAGWALQAMSAILVPVVFAGFVAMVMAPLDRNLADRLPERLEWLSKVAVMLILLGILVLFMGGLAFAGQQFLEKVPALTEELAKLVPSGELEIPGLEDDAGAAGGSGSSSDEAGAAATAGGFGGQLGDMIRRVGGSLGGWAVEQGTGLAQSAALMLGGLAGGIVIVFFLVLLALGERATWRCKLDSLTREPGRRTWRDIFDTTNQRLRQFLLVRTALGIVSAGLYVAWLAIFGVDLLVVWAVLTFLLTFIPNIGSIISGTLPVLYALLVLDFGTALIVAAGLLVIEQVIGNFVDPKIQGRQVVLSPAVILVALLVWGWIWGAAGALLATPITIAALVTFNHIKPLRPIALMLSNQPDQKSLDKHLA